MTIDSSTVLGAPGGTAPTFPAQGQDPQQPDQVRQLIAHILQSAQQGSRQMAQPVPSPLPQQGHVPNPTPPGAYQSEWGFERFAANIQNSIGEGVAQHKASQLAHAESQWNQLVTLQQDQSPEGKQKLNAWLIANQKSLKGMAKALNQDWLNPEKTDVWREGLKNVAQQQQAKGQAAQGMKEMVKHLIGRATQPQLSPDQQQQMAQQIQAKAPVSTAGDPKQLQQSAQAVAELQRSQADLMKAQAQFREKYQITPDKDGNLVAVNKTDPTDVVRITDSKGDAVTSQPKSTAELGKPVLANGIPVAIKGMRNGRVADIYPGEPEWTGQMAKEFAALTGTVAASQANKEKLARVHQNFFSTLPQAVLLKQDDPNTGMKAGELAFVTRQEAAGKPTMYAPPGPGDKAMGATARFGEIHRTADLLTDVIAKLPEEAWDTKSRAQLAVALRDADPHSAVETFIKGEAGTTLTDAQVEYATALASMVESAQAMTSLQGIGARGSDKLRATITAMLPTAATPTRKYAERQMKIFNIELGALEKGVPSLGKLTQQAGGGGTTAPQGGPKVGTVENGYRFKGGDPSQPTSWEKVSAAGR